MRHFLFETKDYRINPQFKRRRNEQDSARALARVLRRLGSARGSSTGRGNGGGGSRRVDARQKCVVKMQYSNSIEAHRVQLEKYLVREGTDVDGGGAQLYGTDIERYRENMVDLNYRIFLSPQSDKIDLHAMTEKFVLKLEAATGYKLYWQAANHYNTAHPHAHILINGKAQNGKKIDISPDIVKTFMREYARDICTAQIGNRTGAEIALEKERELEAQRHIRLDDRIKDLCGGTSRVDLAGRVTDRERILIRLENLRKMNLCVYKDGAYNFSPTWEEDLRANGRYNAFLKARSMLEYTDPANLKLYTGEAGTLTGKVTKVFRTDDDASDNHAVIIEGLDGKAFFVPLFKKPEMYDGKVKTKLKEGEFITIKPIQNQHGRLTPFFFRREAAQVRNEIRKNGFSSPLATEVASGSFKRATTTNVKQS
jgi:hypothetical protein